MKKYLQKKLNNEKGMTLIELLAVIVIIAIIAAIAIPAIAGIIENSRVGAIKSDAQNIMSAGELYFTDEETVTQVTLKDLIDRGFIDDPGSFPSAAATSVNVIVFKNASNPSTITGTGTTGGIQVAFNTATRDNIAAYANSQRGAGTGTSINVNASDVPSE